MAENVFSEWCVLELLGHRRLAGKLTEQVIAGQGFLRLEIPGAPAMRAEHKEYAPDSGRWIRVATHGKGGCDYNCQAARPEIPPTTQFYGASAVYAITPTTEETARAMMASMRFEPIQRFEVPQLAQGQEGPEDAE